MTLTRHDEDEQRHWFDDADLQHGEKAEGRARRENETDDSKERQITDRCVTSAFDADRRTNEKEEDGKENDQKGSFLSRLLTD